MTSSILSPHPPLTISISFVHGMLSGMTERGLPTRELLASAGIAEELLQHAGARVTAEQYLQLFRDIREHLEDECIALLSRPFKRGSYALMAQSSLNALDLRQAITRIANTFVVLQDDMTLELLGDNRTAGLQLHFTDPHTFKRQFMHVHMMQALWRLLDWLVAATSRSPASTSRSRRQLTPSATRTSSRPPSSSTSRLPRSGSTRACSTSPCASHETSLRDFLSDPRIKLRVPGLDADETHREGAHPPARDQALVARPRRHGARPLHVTGLAAAQARRGRRDVSGDQGRTATRPRGDVSQDDDDVAQGDR